MLIATIITYNDYPLIKTCIESIIDKVDRIICIDGRYTDFPEVDLDYSTDGTLEYLKSIDKVELMFRKGDEVSKRNFYLMQVSNGDTILNLDADEVLIGSIPKLETDFGIIEINDGVSNNRQKRATRFFEYKDGMEYKNCHYMLHYQDQEMNGLKRVFKPFTFIEIKDFYIQHNYHLRPGPRQYYKNIYYKQLIQKENKYRKQ